MSRFQLKGTMPVDDDLALRDRRRQLNWDETAEIRNRIANGLLSLRLEPAPRVAVFAENAVEVALVYLGGLYAGVSVVPVSFHLTAEEAGYIFSDAGVQVVFVDENTCERGLAAAQLSGVTEVFGWDAGDTAVVDFWLWVGEQAEQAPPADIRPLSNLLYTSGTTGRPKGTELPPTMFPRTATVAEHLQLLSDNPLVDCGRHLVVGPMYHTGPLAAVRLNAVGMPLVILGRFDAQATLAAIETFRIGSSSMVPTHFLRLLNLPPEVRNRYDLSSLQRVNHTGAKCPVDAKRALIDWWGPVLSEAYGATEVGVMCRISSQEWLRYPGSVGRAMPPFETLILDEHGNPAGPGIEGRLYFEDSTGRGVVYHRDPEKSAAAHVAPGVFTLGEIGYVNDEGYVYITDRMSDMVVSGGVNIYPAESEQVLMSHPAVADVACIGVPHAEMGEELKALVVLRVSERGTGSTELIRYCRDRLSHYKCPKSVEFRSDLDRNAMGKLNKRKLRESYWP